MKNNNEVGFVENWPNTPTQCQQCVNFQTKGGRNACVTKDLSFDEALQKYGDILPTSHCNFFMLR